MNMKSQQEIEFEQSVMTLDKEFEIVQDPKSNTQLTRARLNDFSTKLKKLEGVYTRMEEKMKANMKNKNYNPEDIKNKLRNYSLTMQKLYDRYNKLDRMMLEQEKSELMANRTMTAAQMDDYQRMKMINNRAQEIRRDAYETHGIVTNTYSELKRQKDDLVNLEEQVQGLDQDLSMGDQLVRVIANREMATKLILVMLVIFLGIADLLILLIKIM